MENKEITIIKLLNEISNDKIVPKQIKYQNKIYTFNTIDKTYYDENNYDLFWDYNYLILNDTVEILPEENDEWEDIEEYDLKPDDWSLPSQADIEIQKRLNIVIKNQKRIIEKLEEK